MAIQHQIKVIKATSDAFVGPRYLAHVADVGFAFIRADEELFDRTVLKFNMGQAYDVGALFRATLQQQKNFPGHEIIAVDIKDVERVS